MHYITLLREKITVSLYRFKVEVFNIFYKWAHIKVLIHGLKTKCLKLRYQYCINLMGIFTFKI